MTVSSAEVARLTAALESLLQQLDGEDWMGHLARVKAVEAREAAVAKRETEIAALKRKIAELAA